MGRLRRLGLGRERQLAGAQFSIHPCGPESVSPSKLGAFVVSPGGLTQDHNEIGLMPWWTSR